MGGGWITVDAGALTTEKDLRYWIDVSLDFHACGSGQKTKSRHKQ